MPLLSDAQVIEAVKRSTRRSAAVVHGQMKRGLTGLATITSLAPLVGLLATVLAIWDSFPGCGAERSYCMAAVLEALSHSLVPTALGLLVAIPAFWCYRYLNAQVETFHLEMENASGELVNYLTLHLRRRTQLHP